MPMLFVLVEYCLIVFEMDVASDGLRVAMVGIGECPEVEVRILVFIGLRKHPNGAPMRLKLSQKNTLASESITTSRWWSSRADSCMRVGTRSPENLCLVGPAGTGKSHLLVALGVLGQDRNQRVFQAVVHGQ